METSLSIKWKHPVCLCVWTLCPRRYHWYWYWKNHETSWNLISTGNGNQRSNVNHQHSELSYHSGNHQNSQKKISDSKSSQDSKNNISPWEFTAKIKEIQNQDESNWIRKHFFYKMKIIHITLHKLEEPPSCIKWNSSTQHAIVLECLVGNPSSIKLKAYNRTYSSIKW